MKTKRKSRSSGPRKKQITRLARAAVAAARAAGVKGEMQLTKNAAAQVARDLADSDAKTGRPPKLIDVKQLKRLARIHCTYREMADILNVHPQTLRKRYSVLIKKARSGGKRSLRRAQFHSAIEQKNPIMQIWLGKNVLKQVDRVEHTGKGGGPIKTVNATLLLIGKLDQIDKRRTQAEKINAAEDAELVEIGAAS